MNASIDPIEPDSIATPPADASSPADRGSLALL